MDNLLICGRVPLDWLVRVINGASYIEEFSNDQNFGLLNFRQLVDLDKRRFSRAMS